MKNYEVLFQRVSSWLKPNGLLFLQILCHRNYPYAFDTRPGSDTEWMAKNFFTGGTMPSMDLFLHFQRDVHLLDSWIVNGTNYSKTLEAWLVKMDANKDGGNLWKGLWGKGDGSKDIQLETILHILFRSFRLLQRQRMAHCTLPFSKKELKFVVVFNYDFYTMFCTSD